MTAVQDEKTTAPHGYDGDGKPNAPYGYLKDGVTPRKGKRGAVAGQRRGARRPASPSVRTGNRTDARRKEVLLGLADMVIVTPLGALATPGSPFAARLGPRQATALAGDAVLISSFAPGLADGLIVLSQSKPKVLAWLDNVEQNAPYLMLAMVGLNLGKALVENHLNPSEELAKAGRLQSDMRLAAMAREIEEQARAMGVHPDQVDTEPTVPPNGQVA